MKALDATGNVLDTIIGDGIFGTIGYGAAMIRDVPVVKQIGGYIGENVKDGWDRRIQGEQIREAVKKVSTTIKDGGSTATARSLAKDLGLSDDLIDEVVERAVKAAQKGHKVSLVDDNSDEDVKDVNDSVVAVSPA